MAADREFPPSEVDLTRSWNWGIAILGHPHAELPQAQTEGLIAVGEDVAVINMRHAQDVEIGADPATATVHVRSASEPQLDSRLLIGEFIIRNAGDGIVLEDADESLSIETPVSTIRAVVSAEEAHPSGLDEVWVDLIPIDD